MTDVTIRRAQHEQRFVVIDRKTVEDARLSFRARGLLAWILAKPDNWRVRSTTLHAHAKEGRDACRSALQELVEHGYVERKVVGKIGGAEDVVWIIHERPRTGSQNGLSEPGTDFQKRETRNGKPEGNKEPETSNQEQKSGRNDSGTVDVFLDEEPAAPTPPCPPPYDPSQHRHPWMTPELRQLQRIMCKIGDGNHEQWSGLLAEYGLDSVRTAAQATNVDQRWPDKVAKNIGSNKRPQGYFQGHQPAGENPF